jgi:arylformamidase
MELYDISRPLSPATAQWPGDTPTSIKRLLSITGGANINLSTITASVHNGTHADAPLHFDAAAPAIEALDLAVYVGPCLVIDVRGYSVVPAGVFPRALPPRVLLKTDTWSDSTRFPERFTVLAEEAPAALGERGVKLIGVDVPSVDLPDSKTLPVHHALHAAGIHILESLDLSGVLSGEYELIALPILIPGSDGAFVRAALRK